MLLRQAEPVIDDRDVEAKLSGVTWIELRGFQFDDDLSELLDVEEEQVDVEVVTVNVQVHLATDESESRPELVHRVEAVRVLAW